MRSCLLALMASFMPGLVSAQEFTSPLDVVSTLYNTYFLNVPLRDIRPYFSDRLTERLENAVVGRNEFREAGFDPLTGRLHWQPQGFKLDLISEAPTSAKVRASFKDEASSTEIVFDLVREDKHGWQIDHIEGSSGEQSWCTNSIVSMANP
jgi:hypothetical protein